MDKRLKILPLIIFIFLISGCASFTWSTAGEIIPPVSNNCPLEGKWKVLQDLNSDGQSTPENQQWTGDIAQFTRGIAVLGGYVWNTPDYKIKKVNSTDYIMTKYLTLSSTLVPNNQEVNIITVSSAENFLGEFMEIDDKNIIAFVQNDVLFLQKTSNQVDSSLTASDQNAFNISIENQEGTSGILLGLRIPQNDDYTYQTLWLAADNKKLHPVLISNNIFFPRNSGFWQLQVHQVQNGLTTEDELSARDITTKVSQIPSTNNNIVQPGSQEIEKHKRVINYIGNDYVSIENEINGINKLQVLPVDKISSPIGITVSDLLASNGLNVYNSARENQIRILENQGITFIYEELYKDNFGLTRKNGHWYLQGRINYPKDGEAYYKDFNMNVIPPKKLVFFDTLYISWQNIKDRVPDAIDAFTSPTGDIALVKTETSLDVYGITADQLDSQPLARIEMKNGEQVIMSEWATGSYVDNWEKAFQAVGAISMKKQ